MKTFKLNGLVGTVDEFGFITWGGIGCHLTSLTPDCPLKLAVLKAK
jgi:hypothetical protein